VESTEGTININTGIPRPFLIVGKGEFEEWRARTRDEPWATMRSNALKIANTVSFDPNRTNPLYPLRAQVLELKLIVSASALATILDPEHAQAHADKTLAQMLAGLTHLELKRSGVIRSWEENTPVASCLFSCILALDVIDPYISAGERKEVAALIEPMVASISNIWSPSGTSVRALWAIYKDPADTGGYMANVNSFIRELQAHLTADGVMNAGTGYAGARLNYYDREQKHSLCDILVRQGLDDSYARPQLQNAYEWLYGSAFGHNGEVHVFGDSATDRPVYGVPGLYPENSATAAYRAWRFSPLAQAYAKVLTGDQAPLPTLLAYTGTGPANRDLPARAAPSRIYNDGGAFFREATTNTQALSVALWNLGSPNTGAHAHKESNAISMIGLGEHLITNVGYAGFSTGHAGFTWADINNRALSNNTVLIDYPEDSGKNAADTNDHVKKYGAGIIRGLTSPALDYAVGDSGPALSLGKHHRGLGFVQRTDGQEPYAFLLDRVESAAGANAHQALHPFSKDANPEVAAGAHYRWFVKADTEEGAYISIYPAAPPSTVQLLDGIAANPVAANSLLGKFLYSTYPITNGKAHFATVLYPHRTLDKAPKSTTRLSGSGYSGLVLDLSGGATDTILSADSGAGTVTVGDASFVAKGAYLRTISRRLKRFFIDEGTHFTHGNDTRLIASVPVTAVGDDTRLHLWMPAGGGTVSVKVPGALKGFVNQEQIPVDAGSDSTMEFALDAGVHVISWNEAGAPAIDMVVQGSSAVIRTPGLIPGAGYTVWVSNDLSHWEPLKSAAATAEGELILEGMRTRTWRFYKLGKD
jgi:hypothetical protein